MTPIFEKILFSTNHLHKSLRRADSINVLSSDDIAYVRNINNLLQEEGEERIAQTKETYNIQSKGYIAQYQDAKKGTANTFQWIDVICDFLEKVRNLFEWEDPNMTYLFLILLVVLFLIVTFLPLRFILSLSMFYKFWKG